MRNALHIETISIVRLIKQKNNVNTGWKFYMDIKISLMWQLLCGISTLCSYVLLISRHTSLIWYTEHVSVVGHNCYFIWCQNYWCITPTHKCVVLPSYCNTAFCSPLVLIYVTHLRNHSVTTVTLMASYCCLEVQHMPL
jgi:hypothetical protein